MFNFFLINEIFYFVDVFGYGFVKVFKKECEVWGKMIEMYLINCEQFKVVLMIVDLCYVFLKDDVMMYEFLKYYDFFVMVIVMKVDKIFKGKW